MRFGYRALKAEFYVQFLVGFRPVHTLKADISAPKFCGTLAVTQFSTCLTNAGGVLCVGFITTAGLLFLLATTATTRRQHNHQMRGERVGFFAATLSQNATAFTSAS